MSSNKKPEWERNPELRMDRLKVPGGWIINVAGAGTCFYPDAMHEWDWSKGE